MTRRRWLLIAAASGLLLFGLSFVNGWIFHDRELRGEGYRQVQVFLSAWRGVAMPVTSTAAVLALLVGAAAAVDALARRQLAAWAPVVGSALVIGLIAASAWPVVKDGHASTVRLTAWWLLPLALGLALVLGIAVRAAYRPSSRLLGLAMLVAVLAIPAGAAARWQGLQWAEGTGRHWEVGTYTRPAVGGQPTETMTLTGDRYRIADRWQGTFESSGWTVVLDGDPACPDARGTYHAHGENEEDLRFVMVVDACLDGERAADLETGIWLRDP